MQQSQAAYAIGLALQPLLHFRIFFSKFYISMNLIEAQRSAK